MQGSETSVTLSPQWLLPKPGEAKPDNVNGGSELGPYPGHTTKFDRLKSSAIGESTYDTGKKTDVFRPSVFNKELCRHDYWHDEERDTRCVPQRDPWKEGCALSNRWTDSSYKESNVDQHCERRHSTHWGPDDKESKGRWEKCVDANRNSKICQDKRPSQGSDHYRPWRSSSYSSRKRDEPRQQILDPRSEAADSGHGQNHRENSLAVDCGRLSSRGNFVKRFSSPRTLSVALNKMQGDIGEYSPSKYGRTQLLDLYRMNSHTSVTKPADGFINVPSLTQEESQEPLALCAPTSEEMVILKKIHDGDVVSSDMSQVPENEPVVRNSTSMVPSRRNKLEDLPSAINNYEDETSDNLRGAHNSEAPSYKKCGYQYGLNSTPEALRANEVPHAKPNEAVNELQKSSVHSVASWGPSHTMRKQSINSSFEVCARESHLIRTQQKKNVNAKWEASEGYDSDLTRESTKNRQPYDVLGRDENAKQYYMQDSVGDLSLYYNDPQGQTRGPFSGSDLIKWWEAGFFGLDLEVRPAGTSSDTPFSLLGDVILQLRAKARPPPGFIVPTLIKAEETINRPEISGLGMLHAVPTETHNELRNKDKLSREAENPVLQSLISSNLINSSLENLSLSKGLREDAANSSVSKLAIGVDSRNDFNSVLVQKLLLEQQSSLPRPHLLADVPHQNVNLMSILRGTAEESSPFVTKETTAESYFLGQGGFGTQLDVMDTYRNLNFSPQTAAGTHHQRLQSDQPSFMSSMAQSIAHSSGLATMERLLSSVLLQDPSIVKIMQEQQQQLLLEQQQKLLHQQQQQLLLQQQLLRQQEEHKCSKVLPDRESSQCIDESSSSDMHAVGVPPESIPIVNRVTCGLCAPHEMFQPHSPVALGTLQDTKSSHQVFQADCQVLANASQDESAPHAMFHNSSRLSSHTSQDTKSSRRVFLANCQVPTYASQDESAPHAMFRNNSNLSSHTLQDAITAGFVASITEVSKDVGNDINFEASAPSLLHQFFDTTSHRESWDATLPGQHVEIQHKDLLADGMSSALDSNTSNVLEEPRYLIEVESTQGKGDSGEHKPIPLQNSEMVSGHQAWRPPPVLKSKSLLEIQQEEKYRTQTQMTTSEFHASLKSTGSSSTWNAGVSDLEPSLYPDSRQDAYSAGSYSEESQNAPNLWRNGSHLQTDSDLENFDNWSSALANCLPSQAWPIDPGKLSKPTSFKDILKEQEQNAFCARQTACRITPIKVHSDWETCGSGPTQELTRCSPSNSKSSFQIDVLASFDSNFGDQLFWSLPDPSNLEANWETKGGALEEVQEGILAHLKPLNSNLAEDSHSSSFAAAQLSQKRSKGTTTEQSEANEFRAWCESESMRLTGSNDTSILEFCLRQPTSEAEIILNDNLGVHDPDHKFIEMFLNRKEQLSADVLEIAFQSHIDWNSSVLDGDHVNTIVMGSEDADPIMVKGDDGYLVVGKKKGKKGNKFRPSNLGFTVCSNRFLAGEIQTVEN